MRRYKLFTIWLCNAHSKTREDNSILEPILQWSIDIILSLFPTSATNSNNLKYSSNERITRDQKTVRPVFNFTMINITGFQICLSVCDKCRHISYPGFGRRSRDVICLGRLQPFHSNNHDHSGEPKL